MKHFRIHEVHEADLYVEAESEEAALAQWGNTIHITLEDEHGIPIEPDPALGFETLVGTQLSDTEITEVDEKGDPVEP